MVLLAGLGNPGRQYDGTRHNIGFEVMDKLAFDYNIKVNRLKFKALYGEGIIHGQKVILVKPQTYMNLSGESIREFVSFYKGAQCVVVYDDIHLPLGSIRIKNKGSDGGHNGIKNILYHLETDEFTRIKVGVSAKPDQRDLKDYVLGKFTKAEFPLMVEGVTKATQAIEIMLREESFLQGALEAMNQFNRKVKEAEVGE